MYDLWSIIYSKILIFGAKRKKLFFKAYPRGKNRNFATKGRRDYSHTPKFVQSSHFKEIWTELCIKMLNYWDVFSGVTQNRGVPPRDFGLRPSKGRRRPANPLLCRLGAVAPKERRPPRAAGAAGASLTPLDVFAKAGERHQRGAKKLTSPNKG